jgi:hypothetical protein
VENVQPVNYSNLKEIFGTLSRWELASVLFPAVLGLMGVCMAISPPNEKGPKVKLYRALWITAFSVVTALGVLSALYQIGKSRVENLRVQTGYCFLLAYEPSYLYPGPAWTLFAINPNDSPIFDVTVILFERPKLAESNLDWAKAWAKRIEIDVGTLPNNANKDTHHSILPGAYEIEIQTRYERFTETIEIWPNPDKKALHKWHGHIEVKHFPDGRLVRPPMSF